LVTQPGGRAYVISAALFGTQGQINVDGASFSGAMPAWSQLSDADLAAVLNYVSHAWNNDKALPAGFAPFAASEIGAVRAKPLKPDEVHALRPGAAAASGTAPTPATAVSFTADQAAHGKTLYNKTCVDCHGSTLDNGEFGGPPLKGDYFKNHWGAGSVAALVAFTKAKMPTDRPGSLSDQNYVDIIAYLLDANGYPSSDKDLPVDAAAQQAMSLKRAP
jgi:mono/diheme cytochrome c family protein